MCSDQFDITILFYKGLGIFLPQQYGVCGVDTLEQLIAPVALSTNKKVKRFQKRIKKYSVYLFSFLEPSEIPYDNNASERAIPNMKVKMRVSGMFKTK